MSERTTAMDAKLTIAPRPRASSSGTAAWHMKNAVLKLTDSSRSSSSGFTSVNGPKLKKPPATFTTMSSPPNCAWASAVAERPASGCVRSPADALAAMPSALNSLTRSARPTALSSASSNFAPARPRRRARAWPIWRTRPTPVTSATLPLRLGGTDDVIHRWRAALREPHRPVPADHVHRPLDALAVVFERMVGARDRALRIGEQRKIELHLVHVTLMALDGGRIYPERLDLSGVELGNLIAHGGELAVSAGSVIARIEDQRDGSLFQKIRQRVGPAVRSGSRERRGLTPDWEWFAHPVSSS